MSLAAKIDFIVIINERRQCFSAAPESSPPRPTPRPVIPAGITPESSASRPTPLPSVRPSTYPPTPAATSFNPQPTPQTTPRPVSQPTPRPIARPTRTIARTTTTPTSQNTTRTQTTNPITLPPTPIADPPVRYPPTPAPRSKRRRHATTSQDVYDELLIAALDTNRTHHISIYDDYDALMARVTGQLTYFDAPRNPVEMEYDVGAETDHLDFAWGKDGVIRAYYLGQHSVSVIQIITITYNGRRTNIEGAAGLAPGWFDSRKFSQALLVVEFSKDDLWGRGDTHVTIKIITVVDEVAKVIGVFVMDVDKGMWHNIVNGLSWTYGSLFTGAGVAGEVISSAGSVLGESLAANVDAAGSGLGTVSSAVGDGIVVIGNVLGESLAANVDAAGEGIVGLGNGLRGAGGAIGEGLRDAGGAIGEGLGSVVGGVTDYVGDVMYNMVTKAFYESGYLQAAATIAVVLVLIDLKKNKII